MNHLFALLLVLAMAISPTFAHEGHNEAFSGTQANTTNSLRPLKVDPEGQQAIGIQTQIVGTGKLEQTLSTTGQVQAAENKAVDMNPPVAGIVRQVHVKHGDWVRAGQVLALIHSPDVAETMSHLLQEQARIQTEMANTRNQAQRDITVQTSQVQLTRANFLREQTLLKEGITARRDFLEAQTAYRTAQAELAATRRQSSQQIALMEKQLALTTSAVKSQLRAMGLPAISVDRAIANWGVTAQIPILAPVSGYITFRDITLGETVSTDKRIFSIVNLSPIWVVLNVFQEHIPQIRLGQKVHITTPASQRVDGEISSIGTVIDPNQRTLPVRVVSSNPGALLKPGMFVTADIVTGQTSGGQQVVIPTSALIEEGGQPLVYVKEGNHFQPIIVRIGHRTSNQIEVTEGLFVGDQVVTRGAKQLHAQRLLGGETAPMDTHSHTTTQNDNLMPMLLGVFIGLGIAALGIVAWALIIRRAKRTGRHV